MNWIDKFFPVFTLIMGWGLSEFGKLSVEKRRNRKKLKKLLFNLLELRWLLKRELDLNKEITIYIERFKARLSEKFGSEATDGIDMVKPILIEILKDKIVESNRIKEIETNIDLTITELAEIYPVFAYELSGTYKIKQRLESAEDYFNKISSLTEELPEEYKDWIKPKISSGLLNEMDTYIVAIAKKISRKTRKNISNRLSFSNIYDTEEIDEFLNQYIEKIKTIEQKE